MNYTYLTIIVPAAAQAEAQALSSDGYFTTPLSESGEAPATHYITSGPFDNETSNILLNSSIKKLVACGQDAFGAMAKAGLKLVQEAPID